MVLCVSAPAQTVPGESGEAEGCEGKLGSQEITLIAAQPDPSTRASRCPGWKRQLGSVKPAGRGELLLICTGLDLVPKGQTSSSTTTTGRGGRWRQERQELVERWSTAREHEEQHLRGAEDANRVSLT